MFAPVADQKVLAGAAGTLRWQYLDQDGEPTDPGTVEVGVVRADGTEVLPPATATVSDGDARTVALTPTQTASLDILTATWTRTTDSTDSTTRVDVVGGFYFTVAQARSSDPTFKDQLKYPDTDIQARRLEVEDEFERITETSFVPRFRREALDGTGTDTLMLPTPLPRQVIAVTELDSTGGETEWSAADVANVRLDETGTLTSPRAWPCGRANIVIAWEHGMHQPPPDVRKAALLRLRYVAVQPNTAVPDRASRFQVEGGSVYTLDTAGQQKTGVPDVDAVLARWSMHVPGVA